MGVYNWFAPFMLMEKEDWFKFNLNHKQIFHVGFQWAEVQAICYQLFWIWHNKLIHQANFIQPYNLKRTIMQYVEKVGKATTNDVEGRKVKGKNEIAWHPPSKGQVKLNTNGFIKHEVNKASSGRLIRDAYGRWLLGFSKYLGCCSVFVAKCQAMVCGLKLA